MTKNEIAVLLLDDDQDVINYLSYALGQLGHNFDVFGSTAPRIDAQHDIYLIDNDFGGTQVGAQLALRARELSPNSLVISYSSKLDRRLLKTLVNSGCDGAYDKYQVEDMIEMLHLIDGFAAQLNRGHHRKNDQPTNVIREMSGLFRSWGERMKQEESLNPPGNS